MSTAVIDTSSTTMVPAAAKPPLRPQAARPQRSAYRYLADPSCVASLLIYSVNRWFLKPHHVGGWLVHDYLNDLLCLPLCLPIILRFQRILRIRRHDAPPTVFEILQNWVIFSVGFEVILPRLSAFSTTADPWDGVAYLVGGLVVYALNSIPYRRAAAVSAESGL